eukprot:529981-Pyramimonas_sp.AAC.1
MADCTFCKSCKVAKGAAYFGPRPAGGNGANAAQAPRPLAAERRAAAEGERLKKEAAAKDREIQELKEAVRGVAAVGRRGLSDAGRQPWRRQACGPRGGQGGARASHRRHRRHWGRPRRALGFARGRDGGRAGAAQG